MVSLVRTDVEYNTGYLVAHYVRSSLARTDTTGGNMISIVRATDFEFYSSTSAGGIQGNGYQCRNAG